MINADFTGAHLYHLAVVGCVLNDDYRDAERLGIGVDGVLVRASGWFDPSTWSSTGVNYEIEVASSASDAAIERLLDVVDGVAEIPKALRAGAAVARGSRG